MQAYSAPPQEGQVKRLPGAAPASSVEQALLSSRTELRAIERLLFNSDPYSPSGLMLAQLRLLLSQLEGEIAIKRDGALSLLRAACQVGGRSTTDLQRFLGAER